MKGKVLSTCISEKKGTRKHPVPYVTLVEDHGILGDAHAASSRTHHWHRQISLLANESVDTMRKKGVELNAGDFAENILTEGIDLKALPIGTHLIIGETELEAMYPKGRMEKLGGYDKTVRRSESSQANASCQPRASSPSSLRAVLSDPATQ